MSTSQYAARRDRRRSLRYNVDSAAKLYSDSQAVEGRLLELSTDGARVRVLEANHVQGEYIVSIPFGRDPEEAINILAVTCHITEHSVGLRWLGRPSVDARMKLVHLIEGEFKMPQVKLAPLLMFVWPSTRARQK